MRHVRTVLACVLACSAIQASVARADPPASREPEPSHETPRSHWEPQWERFGAANAAIAVIAEGAAFAVYFAEPVREPRWTERLPLDDELRAGLRIHPEGDRQAAIAISDAMLALMLGWPMLIDAMLIAGIAHGDSDAALQMALIDLETLAVAHMVTWLTSRLAGRVRPEAIECARDGSCGDTGSGPVASFVGGHSLMSYASAGLICTHHLAHPWMLGGIEGAGLACAGGLAIATATSFLRVGVDRHWASDVGIGAAIGAAIGFGMPLALHYLRPRPGAPRAAPISLLHVRAGAGNDPSGLSVSGAF